jgi:hypothetical protein
MVQSKALARALCQRMSDQDDELARCRDDGDVLPVAGPRGEEGYEAGAARRLSPANFDHHTASVYSARVQPEIANQFPWLAKHSTSPIAAITACATAI